MLSDTMGAAVLDSHAEPADVGGHAACKGCNIGRHSLVDTNQ